MIRKVTFKKSFMICLVCILMVASISITTYAHSTSQSGIIDNEFMTRYYEYDYESNYICWSIDEPYHNGGVNLTYKFDTGLSQNTCDLFEDGAALWNNNTSANITFSSSSNGIISEYDYYWEPSLIAFFDPVSVDSSGHLTEWVICVNTAAEPSATAIDVAHEIGHAFGLYDLYNSVHIGCLMYGYTSSTATAPTSNDIKGFNVITGLHSSHIWMYLNSRKTCYTCSGAKTESHSYVWSDYSSAYHRGVCSDCSQTVYECHSFYWGMNGCSRCGRTAPIVVPYSSGLLLLIE